MNELARKEVPFGSTISFKHNTRGWTMDGSIDGGVDGAAVQSMMVLLAAEHEKIKGGKAEEEGRSLQESFLDEESQTSGLNGSRT